MIKILVLTLLTGIGLACSTQTKNKEIYSKLDSQSFLTEWKKNREKSILVDVRTSNEFNQGSIDDAINIDFYSKNFEASISKLDTNKIVFVFCKAGGRSAKASNLFIKAGFKKVYDLKGGYLSISK